MDAPRPHSRRSLLKTGAGSAALVALAGLLDACGATNGGTSNGGSGGGGGSSAPVTTNFNTGVGPATGQPITRLAIGLPGSLSNLYPGVEDGILNYYIAALTMEGLVYVDPSGTTRPAVAEKIGRAHV